MSSEQDTPDTGRGTGAGATSRTSSTAADQTRVETLRRRVLLVQRCGATDTHTDADTATTATASTPPKELLTGTCAGPFGPCLYARQNERGDGAPPTLFEVRQHQRKTSSWFLRNNVVQDGGLWALTEADPALALMNALSSGGAPGGKLLPASQWLADTPILQGYEGLLPLICHSQAAGEDVFFGLSDERCVAYLRVKVRRLAADADGTIHRWYREAEGAGGPAAAVAADAKQRTLQALHLVQEYAPLHIFDLLCASLAVDLAEFRKMQGMSERNFHTSFVSRDVDLKRKREEEEEDKKKKALSTASMAVKRTMKQGAPKGNMSIMSFFKKKA